MSPKSPHPWLDTTHDPVYIAWLPERAADAELIHYFECLEPFLMERPRRYAFVTDARFAAKATASHRRIVADSERRMAEFDRTWCAGVAIAAPSAMLRGMVTAVFWLAPPAYAFRIVPTVTEGVVWAQGRLAQVS